MVVYILNKDNKPLMPCRPQRARKLIKEKKAKVVSYKPFTIKLLYGSYGYTQNTNLGIDLGSKHIGVAISSQDIVLSKGEIELRQDVSSLIETKATLRRSRRNRKTRYRKCKFNFRNKRVFNTPKGTKLKPLKKVAKAPIANHLEKQVGCSKGSNSKNNWRTLATNIDSSRLDGWLPPSIQSRIDNTFFWIDKYYNLLPKCNLSIEVGKFDMAKMINPEIEGTDYQQGEAFGFYNTRYYVFARDNYTCQVCKKSKDKILHTHHVLYKSKGGSDRAENLATVCDDCHTYENHQPGGILYEWMIKKKKMKSYKEPPFMNAMRLRVFKKYPNANITYGSITTPKRKELGLDKSHFNDAIAISGIDTIKSNCNEVFKIRQFRKKKRSLHEATARKGRKTKNTESKRNEKNTNYANGFYLNDKVKIFSQTGYITGFSGTSSVYVKNINDEYITIPEKKYKQVPISNLKFISHNNNWQYEHCWSV